MMNCIMADRSVLGRIKAILAGQIPQEQGERRYKGSYLDMALHA